MFTGFVGCGLYSEPRPEIFTLFSHILRQLLGRFFRTGDGLCRGLGTVSVSQALLGTRNCPLSLSNIPTIIEKMQPDINGFGLGCFVYY